MARSLIFAPLLTLLFALLPGLAVGQSQRLIDLIHDEAHATGVPSHYALAIAEKSSGFDTRHVGRNGGVGVMGVRPDLARKHLPSDTDWLDYPPVNVRAAMRVLAELKQRHGRWDKVLTVYRTGKDTGTRYTRRWVDEVLHEAEHWQARHHHDQPRYSGRLDDFPLPRRDSQPIEDGCGWTPIHRYPGSGPCRR